jgi:ABC-type polysaccharide/polyol phosphate transport system ATPase subunit
MTSIRVSGASVRFPILAADGNSLKSYWTRALSRRANARQYIPALTDISLTIHEGERVGIIGSNGAGKTTLLKLLSGIYPPVKGMVDIDGRLSPLLDLGVGFENELSGFENIRLRLMFLGLSMSLIDSKIDEIVEFCELGHFIYQPVKTYSSGMFIRLAFAISTCIEPEILILDEFMSAGDLKFNRKADARMDQFMNSGKIVVIASHALGAVSERCSRALWIKEGRIVADGPAVDVVADYTRAEQAQ